MNYLNEKETHQYLHDVFINTYNGILATAHGTQRVVENFTGAMHELQREALTAATDAVKAYKELFEEANKPTQKK